MVHALHTEMEFEVQELDDEDKPEVDVKKPQKWLLEDPIHKGSVLPGFHLAKDPLKKKPWYAYCTNLSCLFQEARTVEFVKFYFSLVFAIMRMLHIDSVQLEPQNLMW